MAETDIFNPVQGWSNELGFNPNWSYGWIRKTASNKKLAAPRLGRRYSRETENGGYSASLNFIDRPWAQVLYIKKFFEQFQNGYFTLINWDGGGRHHVGNFVSEPNEVQTANGKWTIQGLVFEEAAQARMLQYPCDFTASSHAIYVIDDYQVPLVGTYNTLPHSTSHPGWMAQPVPGSSVSTTDPSQFEMYTSAPSNGDYAQIEYVGWGCKMIFRTASGLGQCGVYLDGTLMATIDQSNATLVTGTSLAAGVTYVNGILTALQVPLDKHRVKVVVSGPGAVSGGVSITFPYVQVLH